MKKPVASKSRLMAVLVCAILGFSACDDSAADYFPLGSGSVWVYRQTIFINNHGNSGGRETHRFVTAVTNLAPRTTEQARLFPRIYADGRMLYYEEADDGIALAAASDAYDEHFDPIAPRYVIKYPIAKGTAWEMPGETQILRRSFLGTFGTISKPVQVEGNMEFEIQSLNDMVRVAAGTFHHCLRVQGVGKANLQWGAPYGIVVITVKTTEWYAPSVGLVKRIREESTGPGGPLGARLEEELEAKPALGWFH